VQPSNRIFDKLGWPASGGLVGTTCVLLFIELPRPWPTVVEAAHYISWLLLLAASRPLRQLLLALPRPKQAAVLAFLGLMIVTQLIDRPWRTFPFIPWAMYSKNRPEPPQFFEYVGTCEDGREIRIPVGRVFRAQHRTVNWRLKWLWMKFQATTDEARREKMVRDMRVLLTAVVKRYHEQQPEARVRHVKMILCTRPRPEPGLELEVTRRVFREFVIE